jgi:hypothetical protein
MLTRYFPFPLTATALLLVGAITLGLVVATKSGIAAALLAAPLIAWFFRYCYLMLDAIVAGAEGPPAVTLDMVNPLAERRALHQALLIAAGGAIVFVTVKFLGFIVGAICAVLLLSWLPSSIAVLAMTGNPFRALWPPLLTTYGRTGGSAHRQAQFVILASGSLLFALLRFAAPSWIIFSAAQLMLLVGFALVGGTMFEHRRALGIDAERREHRQAQRAAEQRAQQRRKMLERAYLKIKIGKPLDGWREIQAWLGQHGRGEHVLSERKAILQAISAWDDTRPADHLADDLIAVLLSRRESGRALEVLERRLAANPRFRPAAAHRARLAELAGVAGKQALRRHLETSTTIITQTPPPSRARR